MFTVALFPPVVLAAAIAADRILWPSSVAKDHLRGSGSGAEPSEQSSLPTSEGQLWSRTDFISCIIPLERRPLSRRPTSLPIPRVWPPPLFATDRQRASCRPPGPSVFVQRINLCPHRNWPRLSAPSAKPRPGLEGMRSAHRRFKPLAAKTPTSDFLSGRHTPLAPPNGPGAVAKRLTNRPLVPQPAGLAAWPGMGMGSRLDSFIASF